MGIFIFVFLQKSVGRKHCQQRRGRKVSRPCQGSCVFTVFVVLLFSQSFLSKGEHEKAIRFFDKSLRLYPLPGVKALREKAENLCSGWLPWKRITLTFFRWKFSTTW